ncbi:hypothetical protein [Rhodoblastus sp.]|uniref:hypothetical protein n=1 Tax=Rhodoblastus sp. TaxID=1962975 RepID=UPI0035B24BA8
MKPFAGALAAVISCAGFAVATDCAAAADAAGSYTRPNGDKVKVSVDGGKLYCKIMAGSQPGFEMCHGMSKTGPDIWQGAEMKHPSMPGMMTFNGTVMIASGGLSIKGCAIGQSMCDSEDWKRN